jgi:hypothetical protein
MKKATTKSYALRIDGPLVKPLQELKKRNRRSLNAEINAALEAWVATAHGNNPSPEVESPSNPPADRSQVEAAPRQPRVKKPSRRKTVDAAAPHPAVATESPA